jgi:membrane-bound serine protease (ClpP class)
MLLGALMLIDSPKPYLQISLSVIITTVAAVSLFFLLVVRFAVRAHKKKIATGREGLIGLVGEVRGEGMVFVGGELWRADSEVDLAAGDKVRVVEVKNMRIKVEKAGGQ